MNVQYPSKLVQKVVSGNDSKIVKNVAIGEYGYAAKAMMSNAEMKAVAFKCFEADIKAEFKYLFSRKIVSIFSDRSPYNIVNKLTGQRMEEEISSKAPTFYKCLRAAANKDDSGKKQSLGTETKRRKDTSFSWEASVAVSLMLRNRDPAVSALSYKMSLLFWQGGAEKQVSNNRIFRVTYLAVWEPGVTYKFTIGS